MLVDRTPPSSQDANGKKSPTKELSGREKQILGLAAAGLADKNISSELGISVNTLRTYWARIRQKTGDLPRAGLTASYVKGLKTPVPAAKGIPTPTVFLAETDDPDTLRRAATYYMTALQRVEDTLHRVDSTLRVLIASLRLTVNAKKEAELIRSICKVIVEEGGYLAALVGYPENDAAKTVRVATSFGDASGGFDLIKFSWGENPLGVGPVGMALRTGRTQIANDILADPKLEPWREPALRLGYQSGIALPLKDDSRAFGVLAVYCSEPHGFVDSETALLEEVARMISERLTKMRQTEGA